jgi:hypothetical protein
MSSTWGEIITDALIEIGAYGINDDIPPEDTQYAVRKINRFLDEWAAREVFAYATRFALYTLTPNHQPHLIGPDLASPDFAASPRPTRIESASIVLTAGTPVDVSVNIRDAAWWAAESAKSTTSTVPTDLYYEPDSPSGALYLWPVPTAAYGLRLQLWSTLTAVPLDAEGNPDLTATFVAPQAYENAAMLTLAEESCETPYGRPMPPTLAARARRARAALIGNNLHSPRIPSVDYGTRGRRSGFNYLTGQPS